MESENEKDLEKGGGRGVVLLFEFWIWEVRILFLRGIYKVTGTHPITTSNSKYPMCDESSTDNACCIACS